MQLPFCSKKLRKAYMLFFLSSALALTLAGCGQKEPGILKEIRFERGHGSAWGNQFYIEVALEEIVMASYFPEGEFRQETCEHVPITPEQWSELYDAVLALDLERERPSLWKKLLSTRILDGGEYRKLTLVWETKKADKEIVYQWPSGKQAQLLEAMLEQLVSELK